MFAVFATLILFSLLQEVQSGVGVALTQCIPNAPPARPVPPPSACRDKDPTVCTAVFAPNGADAADNADPTKDFLVNAYCLNATLKANAEEICPSSCAVCCLAPEFKCGNAPGAVCTPFTTFPDLCTNAQTAPTALEKCPGTCGLCNRPGALGGCPDMVTNCVQLLPLLTCTNAYMQVNCMRTCNITTCISTTGAAGSSSCTDIRANCAQMSSYCNVPPYSTVMSQQCRRTCRLCT
ncbi:unnamed protein product [Dracunculus medinensis]|uniref:ShKT domain-containing protein n=1 Tax=Dracunculus medinensis TaxID=318479 RepID=A0A0N4URL8_DRAME|nr:unnamed protein product [Dracunculus medinensis]